MVAPPGLAAKKPRLSWKINSYKRNFMQTANNSAYMNLLAAGFPQYEIYGATVSQASALGAALAIHNAWNTHPIPKEIMTLPCKRPDGLEIHTII